MVSLVRNLNALLIVIYGLVISAAFGIQVFAGEVPCPLCYLQRVGMISVCLGVFLNLVYGVRVFHYGLSLIGAVFGGIISTRQILLHLCPGTTPFGEPVFGISLYTWAFFTFVSSVIFISILLFLYRHEQEEAPKSYNWFQKFALFLLLFIIFGNILSVGLQCGLGYCE